MPDVQHRIEFLRTALPGPAANDAFSQQFRAVQVIHLAMLLSLAGYVVLGFIIRPPGLPSGGAEISALLVRVFYLISAGIVLAIFVLRKRLIQPLARGPSTVQEIQHWSARFRIAHILIYALCEAIGIFGLVALFVAGSQAHFLTLIALSFVLMILLRPKPIDTAGT